MKISCVPKATILEAMLLTHITLDEVAKWVQADQHHIESVSGVQVGFFYTPRGLLHVAVGDVIVNDEDHGLMAMDPKEFHELYDVVS